MRLISRRLGLAALVAAALTTTSVVRADVTISTIGTETGPASPWGTPDSGATPTYGQLFADPAGNPFLQSMTFEVSNSGTTAIPFQAYVYQWNGTAIMGNALFTSSPRSIAPSGGAFSQVTVSTGPPGVLLTPGTQYVAFFSTIGFTGPSGAGAMQLTPIATSPQPGNNSFEYNNSMTFAGLFPGGTTWDNFGNFNSNLAFRLVFTTNAISAVPEPGPLALAGVASLFVGLPVVLRRRKK
jgi:hypothetical protein